MFVFLFDVKVDSNHRIEVKGEQQQKIYGNLREDPEDEKL